jgi:protein tyrosine/serine phosphatase
VWDYFGPIQEDVQMRVNRNVSRAIAVPASAILALVLLTGVQAAQDGGLNIRINNFGTVNEKLYRGAQPNKRDLTDLASLGVKTVIDLQEDGQRDEQQSVEAAGMKYYRIGLRDNAWPTSEQAQQFLNIVDDPTNQPVFIHCHGGRHRAGAMTAIYRMTHDGWSADQAYAEMKQYEFDRGFGHGALKDYVYDYFGHMSQKGVATASASR